MVGIVLDSLLMLLLVAALGYGVRLEKKLTALRAGQLAFAGAVTELNTAAGRAEAALHSLRASGEEADMLHDRILKARAVKQELEVLIARAPARPATPASHLEPQAEPQPQPQPQPQPRPRSAAEKPVPARSFAARDVSASEPIAPAEDGRATRMAALAERVQGLATPARTAVAPGRQNVSAILGALTANQSAQQSLNRARRSLDEDLFAA